MSLPVCTSTQKPFAIGSRSTAGAVEAGSAGNSPGESCQGFASHNALLTEQVNEHSCTVTTYTTSFPVIKVCEPDASVKFSPEKAEDMVDMFWSLVLALVMVWGVKQILNIFTVNHNES